jgi:hypothetical protein
MTIRPIVCLAAVVLPAVAMAAHYGGNPCLTLRVERAQADLTEGEVVLHEVQVHPCVGQTLTWTPDATIDPVEGWSTSIPAGDYCAVSVVWGTAMELEGNGYVIEYDQPYTWVQLDGVLQSADLIPFQIVSGSFYGDDPYLVIEID